MPLVSGTTLGSYQIVAPLGAGGMGEVYRARDSRLDRVVAIKVLPAAFSADADRLRRFEQEARAAAALNHPNILTIHEIGTHDGQPFVVSELLEGRTLRDHLTDGALPTKNAVDYAIQICRGLAAAHEKGIVHRDLKPENLFVTNDDRVKILDFGLAKLTEGALAVSSGTSVVATRMLETTPGLVVGTVGYMAPEQVRGLPTDHRSDIFAFGATLYEMLSGRRAFAASTAADTLTAILKESPPEITAVDRSIPVGLQRVVERCLEKHAGARFQSAHDLAFALATLSTTSGLADAAAVGAPPKRIWRDRAAWTLAAVSAALALVLGIAVLNRRAPAETRVFRSSILLPENASLATISAGFGAPGGRLAVSPDGTRLAFTAVDDNGRRMLWVRSLDALTAQPLAGTEGAATPFWSPDGRFLAFTAQGKLKKVDAAGGPPFVLAETSSTWGNASSTLGGSWNGDDVILFTPGAGSLFRVSASGGAQSAVTSLDGTRGERLHASPCFLPDGRHFLYVVVGDKSIGRDAAAIHVGALDSTDRTLLIRGASTPKYAEGYLLFLRETTLMVQPFDAGRLQLSGAAVAVAERIQLGDIGVSTLGTLTAAFSASEHGVLAYQTASRTQSQLVWFDRDGRQGPPVGDLADYEFVELAPDGAHASVSIFDSTQRSGDLWLVDIASGRRTRFTFDPGDEIGSAWSPDSSRIVFNSSRKGPMSLYVKPASGAGAEELLVGGEESYYPYSWSPDGRFFLYNTTTDTPGTGADIYMTPLSGDRKPVALLKTRFAEAQPHFSPDGRWIAYMSDESGRSEVYVMPFPGSGKWQVSTGGGSFPRWRGDGTELFFLAPDSSMMTAAVNGRGAAFEVGAVRTLFPTRARIGIRYPYAVSADGQRFLINTLREQTSTTPITLVINWTAALKK